MENIVNYALLGGVGLLALIDLYAPARELTRELTRVRGWRLKGTLFFGLYLWLTGFAASLWDGWLGEHRLLDLNGLGLVIALWDQIFGTWRNPKAWDGEAGFYNGASGRVAEILLGRDVAEDGPPVAEREQRPSPAVSPSPR